jgi:hypothetical protein
VALTGAYLATSNHLHRLRAPPVRPPGRLRHPDRRRSAGCRPPGLQSPRRARGHRPPSARRHGSHPGGLRLSNRRRRHRPRPRWLGHTGPAPRHRQPRRQQLRVPDLRSAPERIHGPQRNRRPHPRRTLRRLDRTPEPRPRPRRTGRRQPQRRARHPPPVDLPRRDLHPRRRIPRGLGRPRPARVHQPHRPTQPRSRPARRRRRNLVLRSPPAPLRHRPIRRPNRRSLRGTGR